MQENRLWFLSPADIYYNTAVINIEPPKLETALRPAEMAEPNGDDDEKFRLLKKRIIDLM